MTTRLERAREYTAKHSGDSWARVTSDFAESEVERALREAASKFNPQMLLSCGKDEFEPVKVWRIAPDGEYGAWQYSNGEKQGGTGCLKDALYEASFLGRTIMILPDGEGISERGNEPQSPFGCGKPRPA